MRSTRRNLIVCSRLDRHPRASARAGIRPEGNDRVRRARGGGGRIHHDRLHAEHFAGGGQSEHDRLDQGSRGGSRACVNVLPTGAISKDLAGEELAPIGSLAQAGVVAITDDGHCIQNHELMRRAVEYARMVGLPVLDHCQDYNLVGNGVVHEGYWSTLLGLPGWPAAGEEAIVMRNILLAELCDHHIHCQHISAAGSVRLLREARARGVKISGEVCPHHIALTDEAIQNFDTNYKMNPPLRSQADVDALLEGIADGTLSILCAITRRTRSSKRKSSSMPRRLGSSDWKRSSDYFSICSFTNTARSTSRD